MKLPNFEKAKISKAKITGYLLSFSHRDGRSKAKFFSQVGFSADSWQEFAGALKQHAADHEITKEEKSRFGTRLLLKVSYPPQTAEIQRSDQYGSYRRVKRIRGSLQLIFLNGGVHD